MQKFLVEKKIVQKSGLPLLKSKNFPWVTRNFPEKSLKSSRKASKFLNEQLKINKIIFFLNKILKAENLILDLKKFSLKFLKSYNFLKIIKIPEIFYKLKVPWVCGNPEKCPCLQQFPFAHSWHLPVCNTRETKYCVIDK